MNTDALGKNENIDILKNWAIEHLWPVDRVYNDFASADGFTIFTEGEGCRITDITGQKYIDCFGAIMAGNVGYGQKEIADAVYEQMCKFHFAPDHEPSIPKIKLAKKLADITPGSLSKVLFGLGGTDSIETAMKVAWKYHKICNFSNRYKIIGGYTYHGSTFGAMSTGWRPPLFTWEDYPPLMPGMVHVASPYCPICDFGLKYPGCELACAKQVERVIQMEWPDTVEAFLDVPIPSSAFIPPIEYWQTIRSICDKYGILLIFDCVQSGFGRFGKWFACENYDIVPDIMVLAKALTGGYLPMSAAIVRKEVAQKFEGGPEVALKHSYTFEGHPVACAAALANIEIMEREDLIENSKNMGLYLFEQLQLLNKYEIVSEIRGGLGLNCRVELFKDKKTKEQFSPKENAKVTRMLAKEMMSAGLFGLFVNPIPIIPPLIITKSGIDEIVNGFDRVLGEIQKEIRG